LSARTHPAFAYVEHDHGGGIAQLLIDALGEPCRDPYTGGTLHAPFAQSRIAKFQALKAEVILLLGSAISAARECLETILEARKTIPFEVQIVVDPIAHESVSALWQGLMKPPGIAIAPDRAGGPTAALNAALAASEADFIVLLEAGVKVARGWMEKMADALFSTRGAGIVAPLAHSGNRASSVNALDEACERASVCALTPRVPAASGLCFGLRREVVARIGLLDHESFPRQAGWDVDYCFRAADAGFDTVIATHTCVAADARHSGISGDVLDIRSACEALARRHGGRRISRAFMTLKEQPIIERHRDRMRADTDAWIDIAMPRVLSLQRRRRHR
jgi:hypothetical protein